ncbi:Late expression factor 1, DNA primase [Lonomia obliqua multiple nucleopolyhedrovirus]|uniref:Late expression factor 1, DNA primase n=1 Tax=Lonomia obliqua multiple nucleopolyhedrovirus TaxID=134394 RepID=A0A126FC88_9ABAC|nr:Late expression factor 1, DNA primase [Lonomia obliqua multiple nucleopolyhedrovirus]AKN81012.1 Late expression factor 1, DNA primase [Lonomia obliqua multiple nucleopolyhedrovirus]
MFCVYTLKRIDMMWNSIAYNDNRKYAFLTCNSMWLHPDTYFENALELYKFILKNQITDVHVKPLDNGEGREWVIDADYKNCIDEFDLMLKIKIGATAFLLFYTEHNVSRIVFSGNRGFHCWLKFTDKYKVTSPQNVRMHRYKAFEKPAALNIKNIRPGSFAHAVQQAVHLYTNEIPKQNGTDLSTLILMYWPDVDRNIFCNINSQIRAPFSYNYKGVKFSRCITKDLLDKIHNV